MIPATLDHMVELVDIPEEERDIQVVKVIVATPPVAREAKAEKVEVGFEIFISLARMGQGVKCSKPKCFEARVDMTVKFPQRKGRTDQT